MTVLLVLKVTIPIVTVVWVTLVTIAVVMVVIVTYFSKNKLTPQKPMIFLRAAFRDLAMFFSSMSCTTGPGCYYVMLTSFRNCHPPGITFCFTWTIPFPPSSRQLPSPLQDFITGLWDEDWHVIPFIGTWTEAWTLPFSTTLGSQIVSSFSAFITVSFFMLMNISNNICRSLWSCHLWKQMSYLLSHYSHLDQHQSSLDPWYLKFSSCLNHGQTKTAKGSNRIFLSKNNNN